jgi:hypothetical protein
MARIMYAIDCDTGMVVSRIGDKYAWPILDYEGMTPDNSFKTEYYLEAVSIFDVPRANLKYTRKIPLEVKNFHRAFWGMKLLPGVEC